MQMIEEILLRDQTTGKNILWANAEYGAKEIHLEDIGKIKPRHEKIREQQKQRTRDRAEIFTPPDICKLQNDLIVSDEKAFEKYIDAKFLEITCGEAPYLVNRYNAVTGEPIEFDNRFGLLDRKLKLIKKENLKPIVDWTRRAVQSVYGYDFQGDVEKIYFYDDTKVKLIGRIVGGDTQGRLPLDNNLSRNNLGTGVKMVLTLEGDNTSWLVYDNLNPEKSTRDYTITHGKDAS